MEKIAIGLLRSSHTVPIKKAFIEKLIKSGSTPSHDYTVNDFIFEIETIWNIQYNSIAITDLIKIKANFASFQKHFLLIQTILNYFLECQIKKLSETNTELIEKKFQELLLHLINLIKSKLISNLNHSEDLTIKREDFLLLIVWLRLLTDSFVTELKNYQLCANFINILSTLNLALTEQNITSNYIIYLIQNDSIFCEEYLKFTTTFFSLLENVSVNEEDNSESKIRDEFVIRTLFETNSILIR